MVQFMAAARQEIRWGGCWVAAPPMASWGPPPPAQAAALAGTGIPATQVSFPLALRQRTAFCCMPELLIT